MTVLSKLYNPVKDGVQTLQCVKMAPEAVYAKLCTLEMGRWDPIMQRAALQLMQRSEGEKGESEVVTAFERRPLWTGKAAPSFPLFAKAAAKLLSVHATTAAAERNWSAWGQHYQSNRNQLAVQRAKKLVFIKANEARLSKDKAAVRGEQELTMDHMA